MPNLQISDCVSRCFFADPFRRSYAAFFIRYDDRANITFDDCMHEEFGAVLMSRSAKRQEGCLEAARV